MASGPGTIGDYLAARGEVGMVAAALDRAREVNRSLNVFTQVFDEYPLGLARRAVERGRQGLPPGPLAGVPVAIKDNICLDHGFTTCGSRMLEGYRSPFSATAVQRLIGAGAIPVGKTNLDEFGMGSSTETSAFGPTRNPHDHTRVPGGSSGGSAAAVAAGLVPLALGSDTGGSVRQPAALCGCVGLKPTYGRVSRHGLVAYASSLDQIGVLARTVADAALGLRVIAGADEHDMTCSERPAGELDAASADGGEARNGVPGQARADRFTIGVPRGVLGLGGLHESVRLAMRQAMEALERAGSRVIEIDMPHAGHAIAAYYLIACAEASSNLARFDGVRFGRRAALEPTDALADLYVRSRSEGLGAEVQRRIMLGTFALSAGYAEQYYGRAMRARRLIQRDYLRAFEPSAFGSDFPACDVILTPTTPAPAFRFGEKLADPLAMYLEDVFTVGVNLAGVPAMSVPWSMAEVEGKRLPVGLQVIAPAFEEGRLIRAGRAMEALRPGGDFG